MGCASTSQQRETQSTDTTSASANDERQTIGTKESDSYELLMTNRTGKEIIALSIKDSLAADFPGNMMDDDARIDPGETVRVFFTPSEDDAALKEAQASDKAINTLYDIEFVDSDKKTFAIYDINLERVTQFDLLYSDGTAFITYFDTETGEKVHTQNAAIAAAEQRKAQAAAQIEAEKAAAVAEHTQQGSASSGTDTGGGQAYTPTTTPAPAPTPTPPPAQAPSQNPDSCFGDDGPVINF